MADKDNSDNDKLKELILLFLLAMMTQGKMLIAGDLAASGLPAALLPIIGDYHARAGVLGRMAAGDTADADDDDAAFGEMQAQRDKPYLERFAKQLEDGWGISSAVGVSASASGPTAGIGSGASSSAGDDTDSADISEQALKARLNLYAERLHASAHEAFVMASPATSTYYWRLDSNNPCDDCIGLAGGGPYTDATLPTYPAAGDTECLTSCRCYLERQDGIAPFAP